MTVPPHHVLSAPLLVQRCPVVLTPKLLPLAEAGGKMDFEIKRRTIGHLDESFLAVPGSSLGSEALSV